MIEVLEYRLERQADDDGSWHEYGTYNLANPTEMEAFKQAVYTFGKFEQRCRVVRA